MRRIVEISQILLFYDVPHVFTVVDKNGTNYVCMLVRVTPFTDQFVCTGISPMRLNSLLLGHLDLRDVFESPELHEYFYADVFDYTVAQMEIVLSDRPTIAEDELPDRGIRFSPHEIEEEIAMESRKHSRTILYLGIEPAAGEHQAGVAANKLAKLLSTFQDVSKYAFKKAIAHKSPSKKVTLSNSDIYMWDVYGSKAASFNLMLKSRLPGNLLGRSDISIAVSLIDEVVSSIDDLHASKEVLTKYRGHFVSKYLDTMRYLSHTSDTIYYSWVPSQFDEVRTKHVSFRQAAALLKYLGTKDELGREVVTMRGFFDKVYVSRNQWIFVDDGGNTYNGTLKSGSSVSLDKITTSVPYEIECDEVLVSKPLSDVDEKRYELYSHRRL